MKKSYIIILIIIAIIVLFFFVLKKEDKNSSPEPPKDSTIHNNEEELLPDRIEIVHFHGTNQCWACITVGEYALKTIKDKFSEEYEKGVIVFRDVNGDLPKNKDIVARYKARASSLFINNIRDKVDNIQEDITVWRLVANEEQYINYLEEKIKNFLE